MKRILIAILTFWALTSALKLHAQTREELLQQLMDEDRANVETLMLYPEEIRLHIFEAAKYPEALVRLQTMQNRPREAFRTLVEAYPERIQRQVWDLTRYPGLIERLVGEGRGNRSAINRILEEYPAESREPALNMSEEQFGLLARIDNLEREADEAFRNFALDYPERTRAALRALVNEPEALSILTDNMRLTVMLGDLYRREPYWLIQEAQNINLEAARRRARDLESWKESLDADPEARRDLEQTAREYASEYGYDDTYYDYAPVERPQRAVVEHHYYYHYPYWFGYPYWYSYPRWRPLPYWYDWGFYMRPGGVIVVFDFPSAYFVNWYYRRPAYIYRYPYLASRFADYYYGHRRSTCSIVVGVERWRVRNAAVVSDTWLSDRNGRIDRLREFGRMEESRERYNRENPTRQIPQREFIAARKNEYPRLTERLPDETQITQPRREAPRTQPPIEAPRAEPQRRETPRTQPPVETPRAEPRKEVPRTQTPTEAPRAEPQRRETPRTQPPVETPRAEPRKEAPRTQPPAQAPRTETRKEATRTQPEPANPVEKPKEKTRQQ